MGARRALARPLPAANPGLSHCVRWVVTIDKLKRRLTTDPACFRASGS